MPYVAIDMWLIGGWTDATHILYTADSVQCKETPYANCGRSHPSVASGGHSHWKTLNSFSAALSILKSSRNGNWRVRGLCCPAKKDFNGNVFFCWKSPCNRPAKALERRDYNSWGIGYLRV